MSKTTVYVFIALIFIGVGGAAYMNRALLIKQINEWGFIPRPQRLTELYFTHPDQPSTPLTSLSTQELAFTVHNLEQQPTFYRYKLSTMSADSNSEQQLGNGAFTLNHDQSQITHQTITIPSLGKQMMVRVTLNYEGITFGKNAPSLQTQSIHYWARDAGKEQHDAA